MCVYESGSGRDKRSWQQYTGLLASTGNYTVAVMGVCESGVGGSVTISVRWLLSEKNYSVLRQS